MNSGGKNFDTRYVVGRTAEQKRQRLYSTVKNWKEEYEAPHVPIYVYESEATPTGGLRCTK